MNKTIFDVDDIYALRIRRAAEYAALSHGAARSLRKERADNSWAEISKRRAIINAYYKCPNILTPQPDRLPAIRAEDYFNSPHTPRIPRPLTTNT
jgi:hypothetical protein